MDTEGGFHERGIVSLTQSHHPFRGAKEALAKGGAEGYCAKKEPTPSRPKSASEVGRRPN